MVSKEDYLKFMSEVRKVSGVDTLTPDETGLVSIRVDDAYRARGRTPLVGWGVVE